MVECNLSIEPTGDVDSVHSVDVVEPAIEACLHPYIPTTLINSHTGIYILLRTVHTRFKKGLKEGGYLVHVSMGKVCYGLYLLLAMCLFGS